MIRLLTYNICRGGIGRERSIAEVIRASAADVVVLQEATRPDVVRDLAAVTGMSVWAAKHGYSLGFMSRIPIARHEWDQPRGSRHAFLEIVPEGMALRVFGVHLSAVHAAWTERRRVRELAALLRSINVHQSGFHVLAGDFNALAPGELLDTRALPYRLRALMWLSGGRVRWRTIQAVLDAQYVDAFRSRDADDSGLTFPTWAPHVRLDYVFVPVAFAARVPVCRVVRDDPSVKASDHFPLLAELDC